MKKSDPLPKRVVKTFLKLTSYSIPIFLVVISFVLMLNFNTEFIASAQAQSIIEPEAEISSLENIQTKLRNNVIKQLDTLEKSAVDQYKQDLANKMEIVFSNYGGHMSGLARVLVDRAIECGGDPRIVFAVAGNESGFGRIPYKLYNPFGYLDGVQYGSWYHSIHTLSCRIAEQHLVPCNNNLECFIRRYGGTDTNKEVWLRNVRWFISQVQ